MTNEEAIKLIDDRMCFGRGRWSEHHRPVIDEYWQAGEMAIKALEQPEIIRCKDCKYWVPGYITDNDDFIPPKCGEWQQMVGHSSDDYCSLAERREVTT